MHGSVCWSQMAKTLQSSLCAAVGVGRITCGSRLLASNPSQLSPITSTSPSRHAPESVGAPDRNSCWSIFDFSYRGALVAWSNVSTHLLAAATYCLVLKWLEVGNLSDSELKIAIGGLFSWIFHVDPHARSCSSGKKRPFTRYTYVGVSATAKIKPPIVHQDHSGQVHPVVK